MSEGEVQVATCLKCLNHKEMEWENIAKQILKMQFPCFQLVKFTSPMVSLMVPLIILTMHSIPVVQVSSSLLKMRVSVV